MARDCGSCSLCCNIFKIDALEKPPNIYCKHCNVGKVGSCGIYEDRPEACINFRCIWLQCGDPDHTNFEKLYKEDFRPDKVGALMDASENGDILVVRVKQYREYEKLKKSFRNFLYAVGQNIPMLVCDGDGTYYGVGLAIVEYFKKGGYDSHNLLSAGFGKDTYDLQDKEGVKQFIAHLEKSKIINKGEV